MKMTPLNQTSENAQPNGFSEEQKSYLEGLFAGMAQRTQYPFIDSQKGSSNPDEAGEPLVFGTPLSDLNKQEIWKHELHGLDAWDRLLDHVDKRIKPDDADNFRFRYHGLFYVAPAQDSFMLRCRIPAGELEAWQLRGLAEISHRWANGLLAITTRSNIQMREIETENLVRVLAALQKIGLTSKGSGVDNVRNITASPTSGIDPQEYIDVRPFAHDLHHYILNCRDLYELPRKFNVAFEGGGAVDAVADTNDIGFMAVRITKDKEGHSFVDQAKMPLPAGVYFRVELGGITGHKQFASDSGILVPPDRAVALAVAMIRVFTENGDRTDRKKARLKYLIDKWGVPRFLEETQKRLDFPLINLPLEECVQRLSPQRHGHVGVHAQKQKGFNYVGVVVPVGILVREQVCGIAALAESCGSGSIRLTPWQNLIIADVPDEKVNELKNGLKRFDLDTESAAVSGGLVACTGNRGCKWASTDTKGHAVAIGHYLKDKLLLDQPINIHLTGCPHSCAQHYIGDIGLLGVKTEHEGRQEEGYHVFIGGGTAMEKGMGRQIFSALPFALIPESLEKVLRVYLEKRKENETFIQFTRKYSDQELKTLFT